ncbi:MAG TPA: hypothetical protein PLJ35_13285 [Anaerolineae bacterium]|nr:hypothetical protein [Anaerolineae bacterium]HOQ99788.1 hypothetical protein [Anaerolineae bacterium]HPL29799.1 hypothetical protein [Anaerolineae bacterium]
MNQAKQLRKALMLELGAFVVLVASVSLLWRDNLLLCAVALAECLLAIRLWHGRFDLSLLFVIGGLGSLAEAVFVRMGVWRYANPSLLGIPFWFPFAFGTTGMIGGRLAQTLAALWEATRPSSPAA